MVKIVDDELITSAGSAQDHPVAVVTYNSPFSLFKAMPLLNSGMWGDFVAEALQIFFSLTVSRSVIKACFN